MHKNIYLKTSLAAESVCYPGNLWKLRSKDDITKGRESNEMVVFFWAGGRHALMPTNSKL